ncbi:hypothetical protein BOTBODRAFT_189088 [Botryobasidium botryosum FD-172 SS1]|uniref:Uncharacterized protein n=1 Tax=Botryobasidium botryosum (strain FD-172 SS1) TaxID=930990 RepID=A0A067MAG3_BOTB1|nr:hypothetical protein BOTBODRAFT_189088 [Botryobasidium botryosum FD-172 SS1]
MPTEQKPTPAPPARLLRPQRSASCPIPATTTAPVALQATVGSLQLEAEAPIVRRPKERSLTFTEVVRRLFTSFLPVPEKSVPAEPSPRRRGAIRQLFSTHLISPEEVERASAPPPAPAAAQAAPVRASSPPLPPPPPPPPPPPSPRRRLEPPVSPLERRGSAEMPPPRPQRPRPEIGRTDINAAAMPRRTPAILSTTNAPSAPLPYWHPQRASSLPPPYEAIELEDLPDERPRFRRAGVPSSGPPSYRSPQYDFRSVRHFSRFIYSQPYNFTRFTRAKRFQGV